MPSVFLTGCSTGFGRLAAIAFAREGWHTVATMRTPAKGADLVDLAAAEGLDLRVAACDVDDQGSVDAALAAAGPIDVLVNNAGIELHGAVHLVSDDEARWQFETNVFGVLRMARALVPQMLDRGSGVVINVGSIAGYVGVPYGGLYAATKHAVSALTEAMHFELAHRGLRFVVIEPGQFGTELGANSRVAAAMAAGTPEADRHARFRDAQRTLLPSGEPADAQIVADAIVRAATDPATPLHLPLGVDGELVSGAKRALPFEEFEATMRATLDWHD